ncbi:hypothetical protein BH18ACT7_BH18ACT7_20890 [soil metagenome]
MTSTPHSVARTETFEAVLTRRVSRRSMLRAGVVVGAGAAVHSAFGTGTAAAAPAADGHPFALDFPPLEPPVPMPFDDTALAAGFTSEVLIRWGDGLFGGMPAFDVDAQTAKLQAQRFGFNSDWTAFFPLVRGGVDTGRDGLLWVNHEYTDGLMMFRSYDPDNPTKQQVDIELAAHGGSLVRVLQGGGGTWRFLRGERNRRVTAYTPIQLTGPAAGDPALRTSADPTGRLVLGTLNNCGGGVTGWGTLLTAEENFDQYFANNDALPEGKYKALNQRFGVPGGESGRKWERFYSRFDLAQEPNEPHRFGWVVEIDPSIRSPGRASAPRWAGSSTRPPPGCRLRTADGPSTAGTTPASSSSTSSLPATGCVTVASRPTGTCSTTARCTWPGSTTTARATGCRWSSVRAP